MVSHHLPILVTIDIVVLEICFQWLQGKIAYA